MNIKYLMLAVIIYICGEYLWISKILFSELNSIINYIEDTSINDKAKSFKANLSFHPKYLFRLHRFIEHVEKTYNIDSLKDNLINTETQI